MDDGDAEGEEKERIERDRDRGERKGTRWGRGGSAGTVLSSASSRHPTAGP